MIEVMIVVIIIAITSALVMPMVGNRSDLKLAAATRRALADFQYAQSLSIASRNSVYVRFNTNTYSLASRSGSTFTTLTHPIDQMSFAVTFGSTATDPQLRTVTLAKPSFATASCLGFDTLGAPFLFNESTLVKTPLATNVTITLSCGGQSQNLVIEPYTGEIAVP